MLCFLAVEPISSTLVGTVFKILGKEVSVRSDTPQGPRVLECYLRGRLFEDSTGEFRNQIAVGDKVELNAVGDVKGVIHRVLPRESALVRLVPGPRPSFTSSPRTSIRS